MIMRTHVCAHFVIIYFVRCTSLNEIFDYRLISPDADGKFRRLSESDVLLYTPTKMQMQLFPSKNPRTQMPMRISYGFIHKLDSQ